MLRCSRVVITPWHSISAPISLLWLVVLAASVTSIGTPHSFGSSQNRKKPAVAQASTSQTEVPASTRVLTDDDANRIGRLEKQITELREAGKYSGAIPLAKEVAEIRAQIQGAEHWEAKGAQRLVATLQHLVTLPKESRVELSKADRADQRVQRHYSRGKYDKAIDLCRMQIRVRVQWLGEHTDVSAAQSSLAACLLGKGEYRKAELSARAALATYRKLLGNEHPDVAGTCHNLANILRVAGDYTQAEVLARRALGSWRTSLGNDHPYVAVALNSLAELLRAKGDYSAAEPLYREALALNRHRSDGTLAVTTCLNNLAGLFKDKGEYAESEPLYREALALRRKLLGNRHPKVASSLNNLAVLLKAKGDHVGAEPLYREALWLRRKLLGDKNPAVSVSRNNLALLLQDKGNYEEAEQLLRKVLETCRMRLGDEHAEMAIGFNNLAGLLADKGDYAGAEPLFHQALAIWRRVFGNEHPRVADGLNNLASVLEAKGELDEAEQHYREALALRRKLLGDGHPDVAQSAHHLGALLVSNGDYDAAERFLREAMAIVEYQRTEIIGEERARAAFSGKLQLHRVAASLSQVYLKKGKPQEAFEVLERGRGRVLLDLLGRADRNLVAELQSAGDVEVSRQLTRLLGVETEARIALRSAEMALAAAHKRDDLGGPDKAASVERRHQAFIAAQQTLRDAEASVLARFHDLWPNCRPATAEQIRICLEPNEIMLSFTWTDDAVLLLLVPPMGSTPVEGVMLADGKKAVAELRRLAADTQSTISRHPSEQRDADASLQRRGLFERLIPIHVRERVLSARRVVVLPDGPLNGIPFEALHLPPSVVRTDELTGQRRDAEHLRYFLDDGPQVVYAASGTVYMNRRSERQAERSKARVAPPSMVVLGNPILDRDRLNRRSPANSRQRVGMTARSTDERIAVINAMDQVRIHGGALESLHGTRHEANGIAKLIRDAGGEATVLLQEEATLARLEEVVPGKRYVHLATHGLTGSKGRPYDASLVLTQPETATPDDIGFLTLDRLIREWRGKLKDCDLVVLSACDTQRGIKVGDSLMALPWGFMYAGAPSVVASLWKVDDTATSLLMTRFYQNLLGHRDALYRSMGKAEALREAKQWLRGLTRADVRRLGSNAQFAAVTRGVVDLGETGKLPADHDRSYEHPFFWAAFILIGDPE